MDEDPDRALAERATALADAVDAAIVPWLVGAGRRVADTHGTPLDDGALRALTTAAEEARATVVPRIRALLATDIDQQATTPLALLREAVVPVGAVLAAAGVPAPRRDEFARRAFPEDTYDLAPAAFEDVDPGLRDVGVEWGATKAFVHLRRRRAEGGG